MENLTKIIKFIEEIEGLKSITRTAWTKKGDVRVLQNTQGVSHF